MLDVEVKASDEYVSVSAMMNEYSNVKQYSALLLVWVCFEHFWSCVKDKFHNFFFYKKHIVSIYLFIYLSIYLIHFPSDSNGI